MEKITTIKDEFIVSNAPRTSLLSTLIALLAIVGFSASLLVASATVIYVQISNARALSEPPESPTSLPNSKNSSSGQTPETALSEREKTYPASIPWIEEKERCEMSGRTWKEDEKTCWDGNHSYLF